MSDSLSDWLSKNRRQRRRISRDAAAIHHLWQSASTTTEEKPKSLAEVRALWTCTSVEKANSAATKKMKRKSPVTRPSSVLANSLDKQSGSQFAFRHKWGSEPAVVPHIVNSGALARDLNSNQESTALFFMPPKEVPDEDVLPLLSRQLLSMGFDISNYKEKYLKRRLRILLRKAEVSTYSEYLAKLRKDPREFESLKRAFSINVTRFFRNFDAFWAVYEAAFPKLLSGRSQKQLVKIWSAGCAMGPEPYTLAMMIHHYQSEHPGSSKVRILATDLNPDLLRIAQVGIYTAETLEETPPLFQAEYFDLVGEGKFRVKHAIKRLVKFKQHDLLSSVPMGKQDVVICRNVLIYFNKEQQEKVFELFCKLLVPGGFLLLGGTESIPPGVRDRFKAVNNRLRLYQRLSEDP